MSEKCPRLLVAALISMPDPLRMLLTRHGENGLWHFPDGEVLFGESIAEAITRNLDTDLGVTPAEINEQACLPTETINPAKGTHIVTLHFIVSLPVGVQLLPKPGMDYAWFPVDSGEDPTFVSQVRPSTYEILRFINEDK